MSIETGMFTRYRTGIASKLREELGVTQDNDKSLQLSLKSVVNIIQHLRSWGYLCSRVIQLILALSHTRQALGFPCSCLRGESGVSLERHSFMTTFLLTSNHSSQ